MPSDMPESINKTFNSGGEPERVSREVTASDAMRVVSVAVQQKNGSI